MVHNRIRFLYLGLIALAIGIPNVQAQMNIEIKGVGQSLYPVAVSRFKDENKLPVSITDVVRQNLARSGYFKNTELGNGIEDDQVMPNFKIWGSRGADALAVGS
ncbi:MAG: translocation protein TolB, partial [Pseudomonadota bacterium]